MKQRQCTKIYVPAWAQSPVEAISSAWLEFIWKIKISMKIYAESQKKSDLISLWKASDVLP